MKYLISFLIISNLNAAQVPLSWHSENNESFLDRPSREFSKYMTTILNTQEKLLIEIDQDKNQSGWYLDSQKTDLGISNSGIFGFTALKANRAIEISWNKKGKLDKSNFSSTPLLSSKMNEKDLLKSIQPLFKFLFKNNKEKSLIGEKKNLEDHILRYHRAVKAISSLRGGSIMPTKLRLDLSASFSSPLFGFARLSGDSRVRLEWKIENPEFKNEIKQDQKIISQVVIDLSKALDQVPMNYGAYKFKELSIGLGLSKKNLLSFTKIKGAAAAELFFKRVKSKASESPLVKDVDYDPWMEAKKSDTTSKFNRYRFRKGIKSTVKISRWFAEKFSKYDRNWEVSKFKSIYSLSYSGFLGLSNVSSNGLVTVTYSK